MTLPQKKRRQILQTAMNYYVTGDCGIFVGLKGVYIHAPFYELSEKI